jgi:tetratricopeptide (TPR) repeat protein
LDRIRKEIADKTARNQKLKDQIAAAKSQQPGAVPPSGVRVKETAAVHLNRGQAFYKEKRYKEALEEFKTASNLEPRNALAANNVGFIHYRMGNFEQALLWYEKTTVLDPRRAIAYANLGDLHYQLNHTEEARGAYEKFLALAPNDDYAPTVRSRLSK